MVLNKIMIVDDDPDDIDLFMEAVLELDPNINCVSASDGIAGLGKIEKMDSQLPDYIFLDLNMPRMNGKMFLTELKKSERLKDIPVIIYTTSRREEDINETRCLGADYFLTKPSRFADLKAVLNYILYQKPIQDNKLKEILTNL